MIILILLVVALAFGLGALLGAPYLPVLRRDHDSLLDLCDLRPGQVLLDLGSGDGRLLRAAAKRGYRAVGYEINPFLYLVSRIITFKHRSLVTVKLGDYWRVPLAEADAIYVFLIDRFMSKLDYKLTNEIKRPTKVVSYIFEIPDKVPAKKTRNAFVYHYPT